MTQQLSYEVYLVSNENPPRACHISAYSLKNSIIVYRKSNVIEK